MPAGCTVSFCKRAPGRTARHHALNDLIARSFASAGVPVTKKTVGLLRTDGKRSDGLALIPWQSGKSLCRDVTVTCPLGESHIEGAACEAGSTAEIAASRKEEKYIETEALATSSQLRWKRWASSAPQPANSSVVWVTEFLPARARLERHVSSSRKSRCCCSASTLSYSTTVCRR